VREIGEVRAVLASAAVTGLLVLAAYLLAGGWPGD
jgi:hypothetical protein